MGEYYSYNVLVTWMNRIAENLPNLAQTIDIGGTTEGRRIIGIKVRIFKIIFENFMIK